MPSSIKRRVSSRRRHDDRDDDDDESYVQRRTSKRSSSQRRKKSHSDDDDDESDYSDYSDAESQSSGSFKQSDDDSLSRSESRSSASSSRRSISSESDVDTASDPSDSDEEERYKTKKALSLPTAPRPMSRQKIKNAENASRLSMAASLALQRRKKESPKLKIALDNRRVREVDYHQNCTGIYTHIENQRWREVSERCRTHPIETKTWVYRMDKIKKNILWRMLPIHTAVLYRAPVYVLLDLIQAYPEGPSSPDDRRMLPIHMACRIVCKEDVLRLLLKHAPSTVFEEDIKGRTPRDFLGESKRENKSKVLQKINERNRKNLLKILKEFEQMKDTDIADNKSRASRRSRSTGSRRGYDYDDDRTLGVRSVRSKSTYTSRRLPPSSPRRPSRKYEEDYDNDNASYGTRRSMSSRRSRTSRRSSRVEEDDDHSRSSRRSKYSRVSRSSRLSKSPRSSHTDDDNYSRSSRRSKSSRVNRASRSTQNDVDDISRSSRRSKSSRVSRSSRSPKASQSKGSESPKNRRRNSSRLPKMPRKAKYIEEDDWEETVEELDEETKNQENDVHDISIVNVSDEIRPITAESMITNSTASAGKSEGEIEQENGTPYFEEIKRTETEQDEEAEKALDELWLDLEERYPIPDEEIDEAVKFENQRRAQKKKDDNKEDVAKIKYYEPPKELKKLLVVINSTATDASFSLKKRPSSAASIGSSRAPLMPGRDNGISRRVNACGALKALSKNEKNRLRLGRTKGVVSSLCNALRDPSATNEERFRCSNTLMFLSVPKKNWEAIFNADKSLIPTLTMTLHDEDPRVRYNASFCIFLLAKSEANRCDIFADVGLMNALVDVADIELAEVVENDDKSIASSDSELAQKFQNLGSPSGIRQQGSPTSDEESKRGARLNVLKAFLSFSKVQEGAQTIGQKNELVNLLLKISGTMTAEENLLCMAIIANLTRDCDTIPSLIDQADLMNAVEKGLQSHNVENRKCATMVLQNLSSNKVFRREFATFDNTDNVVALLGKIGSDVDCFTRKTESKDVGKRKSGSSSVQTVESQINAIRAIKNLSIEPRNIIPLTTEPGVTASLLTFTMDDTGIEEKENIDCDIQYIASDGLANLSQWLNGVSIVCAEKNNVDLGGRSLTSLKVSTWNQWE